MDDDGLTLTGALLVLNSRRSGFRSVTIPMNGVEIHKLSPRPFFWFRLCKNSFKKVILLNVNLGASSYCKKEKDGLNRTVLGSITKNEKAHTQRDGYIYRTDPIFPKFCRLAYSPSPLGDTSNRLPPGRSNDSSSHGWSLGFHK